MSKTKKDTSPGSWNLSLFCLWLQVYSFLKTVALWLQELTQVVVFTALFFVVRADSWWFWDAESQSFVFPVNNGNEMLTWSPLPLKSTWHMVKVSRNFSYYYRYHPRAPKRTPTSCAWDSDCIPALTNQCLLCQASRSCRSREFNVVLFLYLK